MEKDRESGGARPRAASGLEPRQLAVRLTLAERAIAESATHIAELARALAEFTAVAQSADAGQTIFVDADSVSPFAHGFYSREFDKLDRPFRWTGKSDIFEIRLRLNRSTPWTFSMEMQTNPNVDTKQLRGFVDYIEIPVEFDNSGKIITGTIPERYFGTTATLTFLLPSTYVPSVLNPSVQDNRTLGLIFYELRARITQPLSGADSGAQPSTDESRSEDAGALKVRRRTARGDAETTG